MHRRDSVFLVLTRIGFAARGLMYLLVGYLWLRLGRTEDAGEALAYLKSGARPLLAGMAVGFVAYGAWRIVDAGFDVDRRGSGAKALIVRAGHAGSGLIHAWLGFKTAKLALGGSSQGGSSEAAESGAATAMTLPGGDLLMFAVAAFLLIVAGAQLRHALPRHLLSHLAPRARDKIWVIFVGASGYAARGVLLAMAAWLLYRAAIDHRPAEAGGLGDSLFKLPDALRTLVAAGLGMFGAFSLVEAWYRIIPEPEVKDRLREAVSR